ncbi:MAG: KEOPS complex subunit Pcc1 [Bacillota bacterium]
MATSAKACIRLKFKTQKQISALIDALTPEANAPGTRRADIKIQRDGLFIILTVGAEDTVALRATLNAYLRWIDSTISIIQLVENA